MQKNFILGTLFFYIFFTSCKERWPADTGNIDLKVDIQRFERDVFSMDSANFDAQYVELRKKYPDITELLVQHIFRFGWVDSLMAKEKFKRQIVFHPYYRDSLYPDMQKIYTDKEIEKIADDLTEPFKRIKFFFPKDTLPQLYTMFSGFGYQVLTFENSMGISLDMFMGSDYKYYPGLEFAEYQTRRFRKEYILPEVLKTIFMGKYEEREMVDQTLLSNMIYAGKNLYFVEVMAPGLADTLNIGYTKKQLEWCEDNEGLIWQHFTTENLLYSTDQFKVARYLADGPFTSADGVPAESAPRLAEYIGLQIVRKIMEENPDLTLQQLFGEKNYKIILQKSKYKPK